MSEFILAAGSVVKFGTISTSLYPILRHGIPMDTVRPGFQEGEHANFDASGVFIGELMAYFSACAAFCNAANELHSANQEVLAQFVESLQTAHGEKPRMPELEDIAAQAGLPVILEIVLEEDCVLQADPTFIDDGNAEKSWKLWRSGILQRTGGIPANWIKKFYFPRLLDFRDVSGKSPRVLEQTTDSALMVGGLMQSWHKDTPGDLLLAFRKQYGRINFSQVSNFDETALERFFNLNAMLDPATRLLNQMSIWQDVDALAKKQEIPLG